MRKMRACLKSKRFSVKTELFKYIFGLKIHNEKSPQKPIYDNVSKKSLKLKSTTMNMKCKNLMQ